MKLLAVGDMHLGRQPSRLPDDIGDGVRDLGPGGAWRRLVQASIEECVDAVVLAGDVVERDDDFFEAYRELYDGVSRLQKAGVRVLGVAGNHDVRVLPRLAAELEGFRLLGREGRWEVEQIEGASESINLWGWSFPGQKVSRSPLAGMPKVEAGINIGVLHCDRDQQDSPYAPVSSLELESAGLDCWLLGHIHKPDPLTASHCSGYLGSLTGTHPGEPGPRGPWLITVARGQVMDVTQWVLAPLRFEALELDLTGIDEPSEGQSRLLEALRTLDAKLSAGRWLPGAVGLRMTLVGHSRFGDEVRALLLQDRDHLFDGKGGIHYFIERLQVHTRPRLSLESIAERKDPAGLLARRLLLLDRPEDDPDRQELLQEARRRLQGKAEDSRWSQLDAHELSDADAEEWLRVAGNRLLERMLSQFEGAP